MLWRHLQNNAEKLGYQLKGQHLKLDAIPFFNYQAIETLMGIGCPFPSANIKHK